MQNLNLKKIFLYLLIASVAFSALLGIGVILFGNFGEFESKILMTASTVTITSILGLACGAYLETGRGRILPICGIVLSIISAVVWIILIWQSHVNQDKYFAKILMTTTVFAAACSLLSLLSLARLDKKFQWSLYAAHLSVWIFSAILFYLIWFERDFAGEWIPRTIGVLSIIIASLTIVTPIFHKLSQQIPKAEEIDAEINRLKLRIEDLEKQKAEISENQIL